MGTWATMDVSKGGTRSLKSNGFGNSCHFGITLFFAASTFFVAKVKAICFMVENSTCLMANIPIEGFQHQFRACFMLQSLNPTIFDTVFHPPFFRVAPTHCRYYINESRRRGMDHFSSLSTQFHPLPGATLIFEWGCTAIFCGVTLPNPTNYCKSQNT